MKALIKQKPASQKEVFRQSDWLAWMDSETGYPLNTMPYGYALCEDAKSDDADDYTITKHKDGTLTAKLKKGWKLKEE